jgi:hypothetical protein
MFLKKTIFVVDEINLPNQPSKEQKGTKMDLHYAAFGMLWLPHESRLAACTRPAILGLGVVV